MSATVDNLDRYSAGSKRKRSDSAKDGATGKVKYEFDEVLLSRGRLAIVTALVLPGRMEFVEMTAGNLSVHASKLEAAGYLQVEKEFDAKRPKTTYVLTTAGRAALVAHVRRLNQVIKKPRTT
jgi:hypothetical protein